MRARPVNAVLPANPFNKTVSVISRREGVS